MNELWEMRLEILVTRSESPMTCVRLSAYALAGERHVTRIKIHRVAVRCCKNSNCCFYSNERQRTDKWKIRPSRDCLH